MRQSRFGLWVGLVAMLASAGAWNAYGQAGVSSASVSRVRSEAGRLVGPSLAVPVAPDRVAVEEIINYHRHRLPLPKSGQGVRMDVRWGNETASAGLPSVLQIGLATADMNGSSDLGPLNLGLVIDRSGSMASANKMTLVKAALQSLASNLRPSDIVSIVVFDSNANVVLSGNPL